MVRTTTSDISEGPELSDTERSEDTESVWPCCRDQAYSNVFSLDAAHGITNQPAIWMEADTTKLFAWNNSAHRSWPPSFVPSRC